MQASLVSECFCCWVRGECRYRSKRSKARVPIGRGGGGGCGFGGFAAASNLAAGSTGAEPDPGIAWGRCSNATLKRYPTLRFTGAQCGYLSVPLDYSDPAGPRIRPAVSRIRHTGRDYKGVVIVNPGGPGVPG